MISIAHASISENGTARGGQPGDQTTREVCVRSWYNKPWSMVLRHSNDSIAIRAANIANLLAGSELVGYNQDRRNTLYEALKKYNFSAADYICNKELTETDCSAFVTACYVCAGIGTLKYSGNAPTTSTMEKIFKAAGFTVLKDKKYTASDEYLRTGDVLLTPGKHTAIALESGARAYSGSNIDYFKKYMGPSNSIVDALNALGIPSTISYRRKIAEANGIDPQAVGAASTNIKMLQLLKEGFLIAPE